MTSREWLAYYEQNRHDRLPVAWDEPLGELPAAVGHSLARYQLGETSDGRRLRRLAWRTGDETYARAIDLFVREEQEHARLLGKVLDRFGIARLPGHWSDWLFRRGRHLWGFYQEITVLLTAEILALKYYSLLWNGTTDASLRRVCEQILHDEKFHVRFHCEALHHRLARWPRAAVALLTAKFAVASAVAAWDHREALLALGCSPEDFLDDSWRNFAAVRQAIVTGEAFVWSRATQQVEAPELPPQRPRAGGWQPFAFARTVVQCGLRAWRHAVPVR
jgi:hypothetical protein